MRNFIQDLRCGIRMMAKRPGFTLIAALTLDLDERRLWSDSFTASRQD